MGSMRRMSALALVAVIGLGLTACGGGDGDDDAAKEDEQTTTTDAGSKDTTDTADLGDLGFSGECAAFVEAFSKASAAVGSSVSGGDAGDLEDVAAYFDEVADHVPDEIADDFKVFADAYAEFAQALADSGIDMNNPDPSAFEALAPAFEAFSAPEVQKASENIQAWSEANCSAG